MSADRKPGECRLCFGFGKVKLMRSWFTSDGYREERCGICGGTGKSSYYPDAEWIRFQKRARGMA